MPSTQALGLEESIGGLAFGTPRVIDAFWADTSSNTCGPRIRMMQAISW